MSKSFTPKVGTKKTRTTHRKPTSQVAAEKASNTHRKETPKVATETLRGTHRKVAAKFQEFRATAVPYPMPASAKAGLIIKSRSCTLKCQPPCVRSPK